MYIELAFDCFVFSFSWINYGFKGVMDVDPAYRCHQSNIMTDIIFSVKIAQCVSCG